MKEKINVCFVCSNADQVSPRIVSSFSRFLRSKRDKHFDVYYAGICREEYLGNILDADILISIHSIRETSLNKLNPRAPVIYFNPIYEKPEEKLYETISSKIILNQVNSRRTSLLKTFINEF